MLTQNDEKYNTYKSFEGYLLHVLKNKIFLELAYDVCLKNVRPDIDNPNVTPLLSALLGFPFDFILISLSQILLVAAGTLTQLSVHLLLKSSVNWMKPS